MHKAISLQINSRWLSGQVPNKLLEQLAREITTTQANNAKARESHRRRTRKQLRLRGVKLSQAKPCIWSG